MTGSFEAFGRTTVSVDLTEVAVVGEELSDWDALVLMNRWVVATRVDWSSVACALRGDLGGVAEEVCGLVVRVAT